MEVAPGYACIHKYSNSSSELKKILNQWVTADFGLNSRSAGGPCCIAFNFNDAYTQHKLKYVKNLI